MKPRPPLRAAIIGCGRIAGGLDEGSPPGRVNTHAKAYRSRPDIVLAGAAAPRGAAAFARRWGIPRSFSNAEEMLSEVRPDLVSVCAPNETHIDLLTLCLRFLVKGVWCEKPLATDEKRAARIVKAYRRQRIPLLVNYQRRWLDETRSVALALRSRRLGRILQVTGAYTGGLRHNGSHGLDLLRHWFGEPVSARALARNGPARDPWVDLRLVFENGVPATLVALGDPGYGFWELDVIGTKGRVRFSRSSFDVDWYAVEPSREFPGYNGLSHPPRRAVSNLGTVMADVLAGLVAAVRDRAPLLSDGESGLKTLALCNRLIRGGGR